MAPNIKQMLVCEICGNIADKENVLAEIKKGANLKLSSYMCGKCVSEQPEPSGQIKDTDVISQGGNIIENEIDESIVQHPKYEEDDAKPELNHKENRRKQKLTVRCQQYSITASNTTQLLEHERSEHPENVIENKISNSVVESITTFFEDEYKHQDAEKEDNVRGNEKSIHSKSPEFRSNLELTQKKKNQNAKKEVPKTVQCTKCDFSTTKTAYLKRHFRLIHKRNLIFSSSYCTFKSSRSDKLKNHIKAVHEKVRNEKCPACDYASFDTLTLKNHIRSKHLKIQGTSQCHICDKTFTRSFYLKFHVKLVHALVKDFQCPTCEYSTSWKPNLTMHIKVKHDKVKDFQCKHCSYSTGAPSAIRDHVKNIHGNLKASQCPHCIYKTKYPSALKIHIKSVHARQREHKCPKCDYESAQLGNLRTHMKVVHDKIKDFKCPHCDYVAAAAQLIENHINSKHLQMSDGICKICNKAFSQAKYLNKHIKKVHNKEPKEIANQTDSLTIYIKPKKGMINHIQDNGVQNQFLGRNEKFDQSSNDKNCEEEGKTEAILGV